MTQNGTYGTPGTSPLCCAGCGDSYSFGKGFILDHGTDEVFCPDCFKEKLGEIIKGISGSDNRTV
jgi:hypothetical protein